jgi:hypothetical protein
MQTYKASRVPSEGPGALTEFEEGKLMIQKRIMKRHPGTTKN